VGKELCAHPCDSAQVEKANAKFAAGGYSSRIRYQHTYRQYKIGMVREVFPGVDSIVRKVVVSYKSFKVGEKTYEYKGARDIFVTHSVQRLALLCPVDTNYE